MTTRSSPQAAALTVIIPAHNRAALLCEALASVLASPLITSPQAVIVVDDGSSDWTGEAAARFGVRYLRGQWGGPSATRNAGLAEVGTPFVAFLDDDDLWLPGAMEPQLKALVEMPEAAFAFGRAQRTYMDLSPLGEPFPPPPLPTRDSFSVVYRTDLQVGTILFRTEAVRAEGGFDESLRYCEDWHLFVRLAAKHPAVGVDFVTSLFRQRDPSVAEAAMRVAAQRDLARAKKDLESRGIRASYRERFAVYRSFIGYQSFFFCKDTEVFLAAGQRREAAASLWRGLRISPLHALAGHRQFWPGAAALLRYRGE